MRGSRRSGRFEVDVRNFVAGFETGNKRLLRCFDELNKKFDEHFVIGITRMQNIGFNIGNNLLFS